MCPDFIPRISQQGMFGLSYLHVIGIEVRQGVSWVGQRVAEVWRGREKAGRVVGDLVAVDVDAAAPVAGWPVAGSGPITCKTTTFCRLIKSENNLCYVIHVGNLTNILEINPKTEVSFSWL